MLVLLATFAVSLTLKGLIMIFCMLTGSGGGCEYRLSEGDTVQSDRCTRMFQGDHLPVSLRYLAHDGLGSSEKSLYVYQTRRCHIPEAGLCLQL